MTRPLRIEFPGALYHVMTRGNTGGAIFPDDKNQTKFLTILAEVVQDFDWSFKQDKTGAGGATGPDAKNKRPGLSYARICAVGGAQPVPVPQPF
jgi:hypothetical protein